MKIKKDCQAHTQHYFNDDSDFMLNYVPYEFDERTGRYYFLAPSINADSKAAQENGLVRRRISKAAYAQALADCKVLLGNAPEAQATIGELRKDVSDDQIRDAADRTLGIMPAYPAPQISTEDMVADMEQALRHQIRSHYYPDENPTTARHALFGYKLALHDLGLLDARECFVKRSHFEHTPAEMISNRPLAFAHLGAGARPREAQQIFALGLQLELDCPMNDCKIYQNIFRMCRSLDELADQLDLYPQQIIACELRKLYGELRTMYLTNHAVREHRRSLEQGAEKEPLTGATPSYEPWGAEEIERFVAKVVQKVKTQDVNWQDCDPAMAAHQPQMPKRCPWCRPYDNAQQEMQGRRRREEHHAIFPAPLADVQELKDAISSVLKSGVSGTIIIDMERDIRQQERIRKAISQAHE